ncbi:MAG: hypothetical protein HKO59_15115 [Phycisphaerales bacterium]|nr:hypothetical protein [Phycisphaerales bacterium]
MRRTLLTISCLLALLATPALAQSLSGRIQAVRQQHTQRATVSPQVKTLQTLLYGRVTVNFDETPAREAIEFIANTLGVPIAGRYLDDPAGHGIDPDLPISLRAADLTGLDAIELVLEQCSADEPSTWQLTRRGLEVGTKERLSAPAARSLRTYPIEAMLFEPTRYDDAPKLGIFIDNPVYDPYAGPYTPPGASGSFSSRGVVVNQSGRSGTGTPDRTARANELIELIIATVEPLAWIQNGGEWASVQYHDGFLVVRAPDYIHRQLGGYPRVPRPRPHPEPPAGARTTTTPPP